MSIVSIGGGGASGGASATLEPYQIFGQKGRCIITGCLPTNNSGQYPTLGTVAPEALYKAFTVYGKTINTSIAPLPDNSLIYTGGVDRGAFNIYIGYNSTATGAFAYTFRVAPPFPVKAGLKIKDATIIPGGVSDTNQPKAVSFSSGAATGVTMTATLKVIHSNGTFTTIGSDLYNFGDIASGVTKYRDKESLIIAGTEYTTVAGDYICIEYTFAGTITSNPSASASIQFSINQNYISNSQFGYVSSFSFSI